jgi:hypothetical protein
VNQKNNITDLVLKKIFVHWCPHLDEVLAAGIVRFVTGRNIPVMIVDPDSDHGARDASTLRIGYGGGWADEHPLKGRDSGITAAILVARRLGVAGRFGAILEKAAKVDRGNGDTKTSIASLLKALNQSVGNERALGWAMEGVTVLLRWSDSGQKLPSKAFQKERFEACAVVAYDLFLKKQGVLDPKTKSAIESAWKKEVAIASGSQDLLEIATIASLMDEAGASAWLTLAVEAIFQRQVWFREAIDLLRNADQARVKCLPWRWQVDGSRKTNKDQKGWFGGLTVAYINSDNPEFVRAFRSDEVRRVGIGRWDDRSIHILIQESRYGVQIFTDKEALVDVSSLGMLLRLSELRKQGGDPDVLRLFGDGCLESVPQWYIKSEDRFVMSGSFTHPAWPESPRRTILSPEEIRTVLEHSFQGKDVCWEFIENYSLIKKVRRNQGLKNQTSA